MIFDAHTHIMPSKSAQLIRVLSKLSGYSFVKGIFEKLNEKSSKDTYKFFIHSLAIPIGNNLRWNFDKLIFNISKLNNNIYGFISPINLHLLKYENIAGVKFHCTLMNRHLCMIDNVMEKLNDAKKLMTIHLSKSFFEFDKINKKFFEKFKDNLSRYDNLKVIVAHFSKVDELIGFKNVYFDTADVPVQKMQRIIDDFGDEKILFGSDFPFSLPEKGIKNIERLDISNKTKRKILYENAESLIC